MVNKSSSRKQPHGWKALLCGVSIVGVSLAGAGTSGASPTVPGAPTITSVTPGDHNIKVAFSRPANDGGAEIFNYKVTCTSSNGGATRSASYFSSPIRVSATGGDTYTCTVMAQNRAGFGPPSAPSAAVVVLPVLPGAPTITSVTPENHNVDVAFTRPSSDGGSEIFNYKATCTSSNGGVTRSGSYFRSAVRVENLTGGDTYTCTVMAQNSAGFGPPSAPSAPVVVLPVLPGAPTITSITAGDHNVTVFFTGPSSNGGSPIVNFEATCTSTDGGATRSANYFRSPIRVGLTSGDTYTCTVAARNSAGFGPPSAPSAPVVVLPIVPGAPTITSTTAGLENISVAFSPPAPNGAVNIFDYKAECFSNNGGVTRWNHGPTSPILVEDLTGGDTYTCVVMAKNEVGFGPPSAPSSPTATQAAPGAPGAPTITAATVGPQNVSVSFSPPASDGGATITNYEVTCSSNNGGVTRSRDQSSSPIVVGDLMAGDTYTCTVLAQNSAGFGPPSAPSAPVVTPS
jgi:hypothetical protein